MKGSLFIALLLGFIWAYFPVWKELLLAWYSSDDYSHGFFIVPIVIYSLWQKRGELQKISVQSSSVGFVLLIVSLVLYFLALYAEIKTVASMAMIFTIVSVVLYLYGSAICREIIFILFILFFMIPVPAQVFSAITMPLQLFVSKACVWVAMVLGLPIFREGNVIHLPGQSLEMVQACSGLRSLMTLLTLSVIISYFTLRSNWLRMLLLLSGAPVAIIVNIIRVLIMILCFYYLDLDLTHGTSHTILGVVVFMLAVALVFLVKGVLSFWDRPARSKLLL
ncbi:exosortase/archaeosortase family protein [Desulfopila sp. IMCC35006]|uniref:exosortase/archaeosortase family protein n=1 Tax=Desulfopila sp. IMCC35006 TaxID=2569542 RepID=UPI00142EC31F|nr:exosortase/archaeosortase family protein [Desulfopila sp. IMCC35006]